MTDSNHIKLLPEALANQIAAGEVIQRPASAVKELLENAVDAGSTQIQLILKDSGKTLVQVIDNGKGMSEMDARMCFERHATSKINSSDDLFAINTKGFRGEALASIAAIAQVELKSKEADPDLGIRIVIEGSKIIKQEPTQCNTGSSFSIKNIFYNVPARRKFLRSDPVELKHILDEFQKLVLAHPEIFFTCNHNGNELYHLPISNLRQRIINVFGKSLNEKILPVEETTDFLEINGFVGKPDFTKKKKADQYFFVNNRYIKSNYLAHAVKMAFQDLIADDQYPFFCLYLKIAPEKIDINVHPTKQEIKFEDERLIYNYLRVSIKHALGQFNITPSLDFTTEASFETIDHGSRVQAERSFGTPKTPAEHKAKKDYIDNWDKLYAGLEKEGNEESDGMLTLKSEWDSKNDSPIDFDVNKQRTFQVHGSYIISQVKNGLMLIDQRAAHERIIYERNKNAFNQKSNLVQKALFPETIKLAPSRSEVLIQLLGKVNGLGFMIEEFGKNTFVVQGIPAEMPTSLNIESVINDFLETYVSNLEFKLDVEENVARSLAKTTATKKNKVLHTEEIQEIINELFACEMPYVNPSGKKTFVMLKLSDIQDLFSN